MITQQKPIWHDLLLQPDPYVKSPNQFENTSYKQHGFFMFFIVLTYGKIIRHWHNTLSSDDIRDHECPTVPNDNDKWQWCKYYHTQCREGTQQLYCIVQVIYNVATWSSMFQHFFRSPKKEVGSAVRFESFGSLFGLVQLRAWGHTVSCSICSEFVWLCGIRCCALGCNCYRNCGTADLDESKCRL